MTGPLQLGLVGFGKIARDQHLPAIVGTEGIELAAVASRNAQAEGVANYPDLTTMLAAAPEIDAVVLCQPPQVRFAAARLALEAGKHVFLEKPPGATLSEVEALVAQAAERGLSLFASWHSREAAGVSRAKAWLCEREISSVRITWKEDVRVWHPGQTWIWEPGGLGVFDPGINALSILTEIVPEAVRVIEAELSVPRNCAAPIAASLTMETASGVPIAAEFDFLQIGPQSWNIEVETAAGRLLLEHGGNSLSIDGTKVTVGAEQEYSCLYRRFVDLVRRRSTDVDLAPLRLVADAFLTGRTRLTDPFIE